MTIDTKRVKARDFNQIPKNCKLRLERPTIKELIVRLLHDDGWYLQCLTLTYWHSSCIQDSIQREGLSSFAQS